MFQRKFKSVSVLTFLVVFGLAFLFQFAQAATFFNSGAITINDNTIATPYPSDIAVAGLAGVVDKVTVTLHNLAHDLPDDINILLESPSGDTAVLMSDVGGITAVTDLTITLDDSAVSALPDTSALTSGTFRPTNIGGGDIFPAPVPIQVHATNLAVFNDTDPNGNWKLYVLDDFTGQTGTIAGGWSLDIKMAPSNVQFTLSSDTINEGTTVTINSGSFVDPDASDTHTIVVDWGDGTANSIINLAAGVTTFANLVNHTYPDDNPGDTTADIYTVTVTATDPDGGSSDESKTILVKNVAPVLADLDAPTVNENGTTTLTGSIGDMGTADTFTVTVNWGDGFTDVFSYPAATSLFTETHQYLDDDPSGTASDNYTIQVVLQDDDHGVDVGTTNLTIINVAPLISNLAVTPISENQIMTLTATITDPGSLDTFTLEVNWGDGSLPEFFNNLSGNAFTVTHQYLDDDTDDSYPISVTLTDDDTGSDSDNTTVTVTNVSPDLLNLSVTPINENGTAVLSGNISDPGTFDSFGLTVDWGDSISETFTYPAGTTAFTENHQYLDDDPSGTPSDVYTLTLTVMDDDGGSSSGNTAVTITNVAPLLLTLDVDPTNIQESQTITLTGGILDVGTQDTFTLTVGWGDGLTDTLTYPAGTSQFTETHQYLDDGLQTLSTLTIDLLLEDDDAGTDTGSINVNASNVAPNLQAVSQDSITEGSMATITGIINDAGPLDEFDLTVDWGDSFTETLHYTATGTFTLTHLYPDDNPTGTPADYYIVALTLTDDNGGEDSMMTAVLVNNITPTLSALTHPDLIAENGILLIDGLINDPGLQDDLTLTLNWGDLTASETFSYTGGSTFFTQTHQYLDDNPSNTPFDTYTLTLTIADDDLGEMSYTRLITITNIPPVPTITATSTITVFHPLTITGIFTDIGTLDDHLVSWDFGDGTIFTDTLSGLTDTVNYYTLPHTYSAPGRYVIRLSVLDDDRGQDVALFPITVEMHLFLPFITKQP